jgi:predicted esterase
VQHDSSSGQTSTSQYRLTVRPHQLATNPPAERELPGLHQLSGIQDYFIYVPRRCAGDDGSTGAVRCPLVVFLYPEHALPWQLVEAERYGMLVLAGGADHRETVDSALMLVLSRYSVDPDKIALVGFSRLGLRALELGYHNLDVFSRICVLSAPTGGFEFGPPEGPHNPAAQFFVSHGIQEGVFGRGMQSQFRTVRGLRRAGYSVTQALGFRFHQHYPEDYTLLWHWLHESWTLPAPSAQAIGPKHFPLPMPTLVGVPRVLPEVPVTSDVLRKMTVLWAQFLREPDSVRYAAREMHLRTFVVPIGRERATVIMVDVAALATHYPRIAAALRAAGLTAEQAVAYRAALLAARSVADWATAAKMMAWWNVNAKTKSEQELARQLTDTSDVATVLSVAGSPAEEVALQEVGATPILRRNVGFMLTHGRALKALDTTGMWATP